jgi:hypothetical protein
MYFKYFPFSLKKSAQSADHGVHRQDGKQANRRGRKAASGHAGRSSVVCKGFCEVFVQLLVVGNGRAG